MVGTAAPTDTPTANVGDRDRLARTVLTRLVEAGHRDLADLVQAVGAEQALERVISGEVPTTLHKIASRQLSRLNGDIWEIAEQLYNAGLQAGARLIVPGDDEWPPQLGELATISSLVTPHTYPPLCLWVRGPASLRAVADQAVAIVGARAATLYGEQVAADLARSLAAQDWTVVSCTSVGVNGLAHRGALAAEREGAANVGVLAGGIDVPYPRAGSALLDRIAERGLLISERCPGTAALPYRFLLRNRLIAAVSRGTVVVEAGRRSGARNTADWARQLGRVVMAVPGPITSPKSVGTNAEIATGKAKLVTSAVDIVNHLDQTS